MSNRSQRQAASNPASSQTATEDAAKTAENGQGSEGQIVKLDDSAEQIAKLSADLEAERSARGLAETALGAANTAIGDLRRDMDIVLTASKNLENELISARQALTDAEQIIDAERKSRIAAEEQLLQLTADADDDEIEKENLPKGYESSEAARLRQLKEKTAKKGKAK